MALGAAGGVAYRWAFDRDCGEIRSRRRRGLLVGAVRIPAAKRLLSREEAARYSRCVGKLVGGVAYRNWYGLLCPLPGDD